MKQGVTWKGGIGAGPSKGGIEEDRYNRIER